MAPSPALFQGLQASSGRQVCADTKMHTDPVQEQNPAPEATFETGNTRITTLGSSVKVSQTMNGRCVCRCITDSQGGA